MTDPKGGSRLWPQTVPTLKEVAAIIAGRAQPPPELKAFAESNGAALSELELAGIRGEGIPYAERFEAIGTVRWRLAAAVALAPPAGATVHQPSLEALLSEADDALAAHRDLVAFDRSVARAIEPARVSITASVSRLSARLSKGREVRPPVPSAPPPMEAPKPRPPPHQAPEEPRPAKRAARGAGAGGPGMTRERKQLVALGAILLAGGGWLGLDWWTSRKPYVAPGPVQKYEVSVVAATGPSVTVDVRCAAACPPTVATPQFALFALVSAAASGDPSEPLGPFTKLFALDRAGVAAVLDQWRGPELADLATKSSFAVTKAAAVPGAPSGGQRLEIGLRSDKWGGQFAAGQRWPVSYAAPAKD